MAIALNLLALKGIEKCTIILLNKNAKKMQKM